MQMKLKGSSEGSICHQATRELLLEASEESVILRVNRSGLIPVISSPFHLTARPHAASSSFSSGPLESHAMHHRESDRDRSSCYSLNYSDSSYWNNRYQQDPNPFEWYQCYAGVCPLVRKYIPFASRILMVGCGNSNMSEDMVNDGFNDIINIDISPVVIEAMQKKYHNVPQLKYITMDALDLSAFGDYSFDAVIDKGTLDSIMVRAEPFLSAYTYSFGCCIKFNCECAIGKSRRFILAVWSRAPYNAAIMLAEITRVLKPGGTFMLITYGDPQCRMPHLSRNGLDWNITLYIIPQPCSLKPLEECLKAYSEPVLLNTDFTYANGYTLDEIDSHFVYVCTKVKPHTDLF